MFEKAVVCLRIAPLPVSDMFQLSDGRDALARHSNKLHNLCEWKASTRQHHRAHAVVRGMRWLAEIRKGLHRSAARVAHATDELFTGGPSHSSARWEAAASGAERAGLREGEALAVRVVVPFDKD